MFGLTFGELFVVVFITVSVVSAPWWPLAGQSLMELLSGSQDDDPRAEAADNGPSSRAP